MKFNKKIIISFICLLCLIVAYVIFHPRTYTNTAYGYSFTYPFFLKVNTPSHVISRELTEYQKTDPVVAVVNKSGFDEIFPILISHHQAKPGEKPYTREKIRDIYTSTSAEYRDQEIKFYDQTFIGLEGFSVLYDNGASFGFITKQGDFFTIEFTGEQNDPHFEKKYKRTLEAIAGFDDL